jgi:hypothetical protein
MFSGANQGCVVGGCEEAGSAFLVRCDVDVGAGLEGREVLPGVGLGVRRSAAYCESEKNDDGKWGKARQNCESENLQVRPSAGARVTTGCLMLSASAVSGRRKNARRTERQRFNVGLRDLGMFGAGAWFGEVGVVVFDFFVGFAMGELVGETVAGIGFR